MFMHIDETIQSQYASSPHIMALVRGYYEMINPRSDLELFYNKVFNLETAEGAGLDIWGRIVGISRSSEMVTEVGVPHLGFKTQADSSSVGFDLAPWYHGAQKLKFKLSDDAFRLFIKTKAMANISNGSLADLNRLLQELLPHCRVSITRIAPMHLKLICSGPLKDYEYNMLLKGDLPPIPAGVTIDMEINNAVYFGFTADSNTGFNNGPFYQR